jgi:hypothetical protein
MTALFLAGCSLVTPDIEDNIEIKITSFEQIVSENLLINAKLKNNGDALIVIDKICFILNFEDGTEIEKDINVGITLLIGEEKNEGIVVILFSDERVISVEAIGLEYY